MKITNKTLALGTVLLLTLSLAVGGIGLVSAHPSDSDSPEGEVNRGDRLIDIIGEEAALELGDTVLAMREAGSTFEEVREYVHSYLEELGVELPGDKGIGRGRGRLGKTPLIEQIGEETLQELRDAVHDMREAGASHEEIHDYIHTVLEELGVELPEPQCEGFHLGKGMGRRGFKGGRGRPNWNPKPPQEDPEEATVPTGTA